MVEYFCDSDTVFLILVKTCWNSVIYSMVVEVLEYVAYVNHITKLFLPMHLNFTV